MKAYQYNETSGLYEGEIFTDNAAFVYIEGITTIAPPEYEVGQVPVFDATAQSWELLSVSVARLLLLGRNQ